MKKITMTLCLLFWGSLTAMAAASGYKDGFFIQSENGLYSLKTGFFLQFQHQFLAIEGQGKTNGFQIRRGRIFFNGNAFTPKLTYQFEFEFVGGRASNVAEGVAATGPNLRDGYCNYDFGNGIEIQGGQFKVPFNLPEMISDKQNQFIDNAISNDVFTFNRDLGLTLQGRFWKKLNYFLFAMNDGNNQNATNKNNAMLFGERLAYNILGDHGTTSSDPNFSEEPHLMVGAAAASTRVGAPAAADQSVIAATGDLSFRYRGFSTLEAGYVMKNQTASTNTFGFLGQAGYFLIPKHFELVGRYTGVIPTASTVTNGYEVGGGFNYYFKGHNLKIMTDYAVLINSSLVLGSGVAGTAGPANSVTTGGAPGFFQDQNDHRVRTQVQLVF